MNMLGYDGRNVIKNALGQFEKIAAKLEAGSAKCLDDASRHKAEIERLDKEVTDLTKDAERGSNVAAKLRELIS